jgi:predicted nucleic acid-binding protein
VGRRVSTSPGSKPVDTDVFVDHLRGRAALKQGSNRIHYSVVTRAELFASKGVDEAAVSRLLAPFTEISIDRLIAESAGRIRRQTGIAMPDALIAATASARGLAVLTRNERHYTLVKGLRVRTP